MQERVGAQVTPEYEDTSLKEARAPSAGNGLRNFVAGLLLAATGAGLAGCGPRSGYLEHSGPEAITMLRDDVKSNVVYYQFPASGWPKNLADFDADHPDLKFIGAETASTKGYGHPTSFVVVFEKLGR